MSLNIRLAALLVLVGALFSMPTAATAQAAAMNDAFAKLRRGKVVLEKYRTDAEPRFVDRRV